MASTGARTDPLLGFRFEVTFDDLPPAGFSDCGGLAMETELHEFHEGGANRSLHRFVTKTKHANVTLKRGIVGRELWDWYVDIVRGTIRRRNGSIVIRDPAGDRAVATWRLESAFPCKWTGPELNAVQSQVAVETFEICHDGLERS